MEFILRGSFNYSSTIVHESTDCIMVQCVGAVKIKGIK